MKVEGLRGAIYQRGGVWWVKYYQHGRPIRETSGSTDQREAEKLLLKRSAAIEDGRTVNPKVNRCKIDELLEMVMTDYRVNDRASLAETERRIRLHLKPFFGGRRAAGISSDVVMRFIEKRQTQAHRGKPTSNAEINRELAVLRRAFALGEKAKKIDDSPPFDMLTEDNVRTGFFERAEFETVAAHLPLELAAPMRFAYITGWRRNEVLTLQWRQVDFNARTVRLEPGTTKNKKGRAFTFTSELEDVLRGQDALTRDVQREQGRICPWVFHRRRKPIKDYYGAWRRACLNAGLGQLIEAKDGKRARIKAERIMHDFRRTAVRNLVRAGVTEKVAMTMTGHKTRSVFDRYDIVSPGDVERAAGLLDARLIAERAAFVSGHNPGTVAVLRDPVDFTVARK